VSSCFRHPDRPARRKCFQCRREICPDCQTHADHHIFCGEDCRKMWRRADRRERIRKALARGQRWWNPVLWWRYPPFARTDWARRATVLLWLLLTAQALAALALWTTAMDRASAGRLLPATAAPTRARPQWVDPPTLRNGRIEATAAAGATTAVVTRDGRVVAVVPPDGRTVVRDLPGRGASVWEVRPLPAEDALVWSDAATPATAIDRVPSAGGWALTFDGGADANVFEVVADALRGQGVRSTFFLTGEFIRRQPMAARRLAAQGHEIGNHTWSHPHLTDWDASRRQTTRSDMNRQRFEWELLRTEQLFLQTVGHPMAPLWRAPFGEVNAEIKAWATALGYRHVGWTTIGGRAGSLDTLDWVADRRDPLYVGGQEMAARLVELARKPSFRGGIVLMHLGVLRRQDRIQDELDKLIPALRAAGLELRTVGDMLAGAEPGLD
jgi:peptidoglycan/xylan/chitin deacetylase (PgdA/CDA1 family)